MRRAYHQRRHDGKNRAGAFELSNWYRGAALDRGDALSRSLVDNSIGRTSVRLSVGSNGNEYSGKTAVSLARQVLEAAHLGWGPGIVRVLRLSSLIARSCIYVCVFFLSLFFFSQRYAVIKLTRHCGSRKYTHTHTRAYARMYTHIVHTYALMQQGN